MAKSSTTHTVWQARFCQMLSISSDLNKCELLERSTEEIVANDMNWPNLSFQKSHRRTNFTMKNESNQTGFL